MNNKNIGKRIREYREKASITQEQLAEAIGMTPTSVSNIERGINYPTLENFIRIANVINVSADLLLSDVIENSADAKSSELSEKLKSLPPEKRQQILTVVETLIKTE